MAETILSWIGMLIAWGFIAMLALAAVMIVGVNVRDTRATWRRGGWVAIDDDLPIRWKRQGTNTCRWPASDFGWKGYFLLVLVSLGFADLIYVYDDTFDSFPVEFIMCASTWGFLSFLVRWPCSVRETSVGWVFAFAILSYSLLRYGNLEPGWNAFLSLTHGIFAGWFFRGIDQEEEAKRLARLASLDD